METYHIPEGSCEVDDLFVLAVLGDGERGRRWWALRVEVMFHLGPLDLGQHNGFPEKDISPRELLLGWRSEQGGVGGGGGRGDQWGIGGKDLAKF